MLVPSQVSPPPSGHTVLTRLESAQNTSPARSTQTLGVSQVCRTHWFAPIIWSTPGVGHVTIVLPSQRPRSCAGTQLLRQPVDATPNEQRPINNHIFHIARREYHPLFGNVSGRVERSARMRFHDRQYDVSIVPSFASCLRTVLSIIVGATLLGNLVMVTFDAGRRSVRLPDLSTSATAPTPASTAPEVVPPVITPITPRSTLYELSDVKMISADIGWAEASLSDTTNSGLVRTIDGGSTWTQVGPFSEICGQFVLDVNHAWVVECGVGGGVVHRTLDGGRTWTYGSAITDLPRAPYGDDSIQFVNAQDGTLTLQWGIEGEDIRLYRTHDGGASWTEINSAISAVTFTDPKHGWMLVGNSTTTLSATTDGGQTWHEVSDLIACTVGEFPVTAGPVAMVVASCPSGDRAFFSTDYGVSWKPGESLSPISRLAFFDPWHSCALATDGSVLRTSNSGVTWSKSSSIGRAEGISLEMVSPTLGFALDDLKHSVMRTTDGGATFSTVLIVADLYDSHGRAGTQLAFSDPLHGVIIAASEGGTRVYGTTDGGASWSFRGTE